MGAFFTNLQIRNVSLQSICAALPGFTSGRAYVSPPANGWVTVYPEATEDQNDNILRALAAKLSKALAADVIAFLVHDSDIAAYWLYRHGKLSDEFDSMPDYFDEIDETRHRRLRGSAQALLPLCVAGATVQQVDAVLHPPEGHPIFAEDIVAGLARLLGVDEARAGLGFRYFDGEGGDLLPDASDFEPVGPGAIRRIKRPKADRDPGLGAPDSFSSAINMLTQTWSPKYDPHDPEFSRAFGHDANDMLRHMREAFEKSARDLLKKSRLTGRPAMEELLAAREQGPNAMAALIAEKTPSQLTEIGVGAAACGLEPFLAALLELGLNPNAANAAGRTVLSAAEQHGVDSAICRMVRAAAERK